MLNITRRSTSASECNDAGDSHPACTEVGAEIKRQCHADAFRRIKLSVVSYDIKLMIFIQLTKEFQTINCECLYYNTVFI